MMKVLSHKLLKPKHYTRILFFSNVNKVEVIVAGIPVVNGSIINLKNAKTGPMKLSHRNIPS